MSMSMSIVELSRTAHHMEHVLNTLHMFGCADHPFGEGVDVYERALQDYPALLKTLLVEDAKDLMELANRCDAFINNGGSKV